MPIPTAIPIWECSLDGFVFPCLARRAVQKRAAEIKNLSEHWVSQHVYCPDCGQIDISRYPNNRPVADFFCARYQEEYELKSQARNFGTKVGDGAYRTMMERLMGSNNPSLLLLLLHYDKAELAVLNLLVIPKYFFVPSMIEKRRPLAMSAQRAGWVGCNISLKDVPLAGRIFRNCSPRPGERFAGAFG